MAKINNFTPLFDKVVQEHDLITAVVYGKVWRYCQMKDGCCYAEQGRIADELGLHRVTVNRSLHKLVETHWLDDITENPKGRTRIYKITEKLGNMTIPSFEPQTELVTTFVTQDVTQPITESFTKIDKKEKKDNIPTPAESSSESINSFLSSANPNQREAFKLVKEFAGEKKAIEIAKRDHPLESAIDCLDWYADELGNHTANAIRREIPDREPFKGLAARQKKPVQVQPR